MQHFLIFERRLSCIPFLFRGVRESSSGIHLQYQNWMHHCRETCRSIRVWSSRVLRQKEKISRRAWEIPSRWWVHFSDHIDRLSSLPASAWAYLRCINNPYRDRSDLLVHVAMWENTQKESEWIASDSWDWRESISRDWTRFRRVSLLNYGYDTFECYSRYRILRWTINELIRIDKINETIRVLIVEPDNTKLLEEYTRALIPDFFRIFDCFMEGDLSSLAASDWCVTRIFCETESSDDSTCFCPTIETGDSSDFRIGDSADLDLMIGSYEPECGVDTPNGIGISDSHFSTRGRRRRYWDYLTRTTWEHETEDNQRGSYHRTKYKKVYSKEHTNKFKECNYFVFSLYLWYYQS